MNRELHYRYAISYLLSAIVVLVALAYFKVPDLVDKLSFALTLSSLLLAILAIFYTIVSAQKQDSQLARLVETNTAISTAASEIGTVSQELRRFALDAPQHFQRLGDKLDSLSSSYAKPSSLEGGAVEASLGGLTELGFPTIDERNLDYMFTKFHFTGMGLLYLFVRCQQTNRNIEPEVLSEIGKVTLDYAYGFLNALAACGLVSFNIHGRAIIPSGAAPVLVENIAQNIARVQRVVGEESAARLKNAMEEAERYIS